MTKDKEKENELKGMPERTLLGKKAVAYLKQKDGIEKQKDILDDIGEELIELFIKEGKKKISIDGNMVELRKIMKNQIKVTKPSHQ